MSPRSKSDYTEAVYLRYKKATHQQKDEYCATYGCHRKHAIRKLRGRKPGWRYRWAGNVDR
jgi:hypothetical protein